MTKDEIKETLQTYFESKRVSEMVITCLRALRELGAAEGAGA